VRGINPRNSDQSSVILHTTPSENQKQNHDVDQEIELRVLKPENMNHDENSQEKIGKFVHIIKKQHFFCKTK